MQCVRVLPIRHPLFPREQVSMCSNLPDSRVEQNITETPTTSPINEAVLLFSTFLKREISFATYSDLSSTYVFLSLDYLSVPNMPPSVLVSFPLPRWLCFLTPYRLVTQLVTRKIICIQDIDSAAMWIPSPYCHGRPLVPLSAPSKQVIRW